MFNANQSNYPSTWPQTEEDAKKHAIQCLRVHTSEPVGLARVSDNLWRAATKHNGRFAITRAITFYSQPIGVSGYITISETRGLEVLRLFVRLHFTVDLQRVLEYMIIWKCALFTMEQHGSKCRRSTCGYKEVHGRQIGMLNTYESENVECLFITGWDLMSCVP